MPKRKWYPGQEGGPLHRLLLALDVIERLPAAVVALGLALAAATTILWLRWLGASWVTAATGGVTLAGGFAADWIMLAELPRARRSFGPVHPPLLILAAMRTVVALLIGLTALAPLPEIVIILLLGTAQLAGTLLALRAFWSEPLSLTLTRHTLTSPKYPAGAPPLTVLHLADIHMERFTVRDRDVIRLAAALKPDVILFSGDFLNLSRVYDRDSWADLRRVFESLNAPLGVYVVTGTPTVDQPDVIPSLLEGLKVRWLQDERVTIGANGRQVDVVGLACTHDPYADAPRLEAVVNGATGERFTILLYHTPDLAPEAARLGIDLQLSGHTHGGQVRLPLYGALYSSSIYGKRFEMGLRREGGLHVFTSRGIGLEGKGAPRVRFLCPPEVALFEIRHG